MGWQDGSSKCEHSVTNYASLRHFNFSILAFIVKEIKHIHDENVYLV